MKKITSSFIVISIAAIIIGCATIMSNPTQLVPIASSPGDADIIVTDERGMEVFKGKTPTTVNLNKSDGSYWGKKSYVIRLSKAGFGTQSIPIIASPNGWYLAGNIIFGGLIGWFIVDPFSGNMYTLSPENVNASIPNLPSQHTSVKREGISIVLLQDVPKELLPKMVPVK